MSVDELVNLISSVGFPIAITIYLLVKFDGMMKSVILTQQQMVSTLERLCEKIDNIKARCEEK